MVKTISKLKIECLTGILFFGRVTSEETRHRPIVRIEVRDIVRVVLELTVVEVEVRRVQELAIGVKFCFYSSRTPDFEYSQS